MKAMNIMLSKRRCIPARLWQFLQAPRVFFVWIHNGSIIFTGSFQHQATVLRFAGYDVPMGPPTFVENIRLQKAEDIMERDPHAQARSTTHLTDQLFISPPPKLPALKIPNSSLPEASAAQASRGECNTYQKAQIEPASTSCRVSPPCKWRYLSEGMAVRGGHTQAGNEQANYTVSAEDQRALDLRLPKLQGMRFDDASSSSTPFATARDVLGMISDRFTKILASNL